MIAGLVAYIALQILDVITTLIGLSGSDGTIEANPLHNLLGGPLFFTAKMTIMVVSVALLIKLPAPQISKNIVLAILLLGTLVFVLNNIRVILTN